MRLAKSLELPGESTVEAMGAGSRCPSRLGVTGTRFPKLPEDDGGLRAWREEGKAAAQAPHAVDGICAAQEMLRISRLSLEEHEVVMRGEEGCYGCRGLPANHARCCRSGSKCCSVADSLTSWADKASRSFFLTSKKKEFFYKNIF